MFVSCTTRLFSSAHPIPPAPGPAMRSQSRLRRSGSGTPPGILRTPTRAKYTRAAGGAPPLMPFSTHHRVKTARTSPRARNRKHTRSAQKPVSWTQALCWRPMWPSRAARIQLRAPRTPRASRMSTHAATRAPQHTHQQHAHAHVRLSALSQRSPNEKSPPHAPSPLG